MKYIPTIGLEVHLQLTTQSKMFCSCSNTGETEPVNTTVCPTCMGHPGTLPQTNKQALDYVLKAGLALHCSINQNSKFDRKNYFYPDLAKGYQISQYDQPLCTDGYLMIGEKKIRIKRIHMEEDTAKLIHASDTSSTLVDFNRSGSPLMELVTEPDCEDASQAKFFCQELQKIFRYLKISDADMEKGHMRCEANISVRNSRTQKLGTKVEVKNINSFKAVEKAILYEIERQSEVLNSGESVVQETRGWDDVNLRTVSQRIKEEAHDYRYFPEPDIPPLRFSDAEISHLRRQIPELPLEKEARFVSEYGFEVSQAKLICMQEFLSEWVENVISELQLWVKTEYSTEEGYWESNKIDIIRLLSGWITSELFKLLNETQTDISECKFSAENFAEFLTLVYTKKINSSSAQVLLREMYVTGSDPSNIISEKNLSQIDDNSVLLSAISEIISEFPTQVADYKNGKTAILQFLIGKVMAKTHGQANPEKVREMLESSLK